MLPILRGEEISDWLASYDYDSNQDRLLSLLTSYPEVLPKSYTIPQLRSAKGTGDNPVASELLEYSIIAIPTIDMELKSFIYRKPKVYLFHQTSVYRVCLWGQLEKCRIHHFLFCRS